MLSAGAGLTHLHLGRLPYSKPPEGLQLSYVKKVTLHLRSSGMYENVSGWVAPQHQQMIAGLAGWHSVIACFIAKGCHLLS